MSNIIKAGDSRSLYYRIICPAGMYQYTLQSQDACEHAHLLLPLLHELIEGLLEQCHSAIIAGAEAGTHIHQSL